MLVELRIVEQRYQAVLAVIRDGGPRPSRCSHQMEPAVEVWVLEARRRTPDWGLAGSSLSPRSAGPLPPPRPEPTGKRRNFKHLP